MAMEVLDEPRPGEDVRGLEVELRHIGPICIISLSGRLDASSVAALESQVDRLGRTSCSRVVVDMSAVSGVDSTGVRVLAGLSQYVRARGEQLTVIGTSLAVRAALTAEESRSG